MVSKQCRAMEDEMLKTRIGTGASFRVFLERHGLTPFRHADGKPKIINEVEYDTI